MSVIQNDEQESKRELKKKAVMKKDRKNTVSCLWAPDLGTQSEPCFLDEFLKSCFTGES